MAGTSCPARPIRLPPLAQSSCRPPMSRIAVAAVTAFASNSAITRCPTGHGMLSKWRVQTSVIFPHWRSKNDSPTPPAPAWRTSAKAPTSAAIKANAPRTGVPTTPTDRSMKRAAPAPKRRSTPASPSSTATSHPAASKPGTNIRSPAAPSPKPSSTPPAPRRFLPAVTSP